MSDEHIEKWARMLCCVVTGHPCGTDTVMVGALACSCLNCRTWRNEQKISAILRQTAPERTYTQAEVDAAVELAIQPIKELVDWYKNNHPTNPWPSFGYRNLTILWLRINKMVKTIAHSGALEAYAAEVRRMQRESICRWLEGDPNWPDGKIAAENLRTMAVEAQALKDAKIRGAAQTKQQQ